MRKSAGLIDMFIGIGGCIFALIQIFLFKNVESITLGVFSFVIYVLIMANGLWLYATESAIPYIISWIIAIYYVVISALTLSLFSPFLWLNIVKMKLLTSS